MTIIRPTKTLANVVASDYIKFPCFAISIGDFYKNQTWYEQNDSAIRRGLFVADQPQGVAFYLAVMKSKNAKNKNERKQTQLFTADGNPLKDNIRNDLYGDCRFNLNAFFENENGIWTRKKAVGYDKEKSELVYDSEQFKSIIEEHCFVDLDSFNERGFPMIKSAKQNFVAGKNIYYNYPITNSVAWIDSDSYGALFNFDRYMSELDYGLGVRTVLLTP